ncbi:YqgE/AlgH family protein [Sphingomonas solaris]|uniref:UPF0301 protein FOY91_12735 n=1 Tax=Alterirhizorhabdus solaris TaxID=2529389 RepID=A0A558R1H1_9SPHN|nr:YqgE/AlgH family protein [Sphingomonas solaris]TVV73220.1 YqgE/AlgH family protein [Sphingomonas solaris]
MEAPASLVGQYLLAMPGIGDPRFERAVIAICAHDPNGALGIGVGRLVPRMGLHGLLEELDIDPGKAPDAPVHLGGPVEPQRGFVLHSPDWIGEETLRVGARWALTGTLDILRALADGSGPRRWVVALGYAGWGEGQLDDELNRHGWFTTPGDDTILFDRPAEQRWSAGFDSAGIDARLLATGAGRA